VGQLPGALKKTDVIRQIASIPGLYAAQKKMFHRLNRS